VVAGARRFCAARSGAGYWRRHHFVDQRGGQEVSADAGQRAEAMDRAMSEFAICATVEVCR
jgi:hypothetical protein